ncbi:hypothetical protein SAM40697_0689 [Streptomyces ambofaciens]|uniref:Uncharacterized protein n=1 Tax=Streptomyces ambofaciens TaxID=1889 RepID=A0ABN4P096_STRAM|nr:hypothetical protein [Streptomyces ambofaciens]ANB04651.1 hypothetical protein SAM40697_0689 [Streptomyces ambofaciens]
MEDAKPDGGSGPPGRAKIPSAVANMPRQVREGLTRRLLATSGSQPMVGSRQERQERQERRELITTSKDLYSLSKERSEVR